MMYPFNKGERGGVKSPNLNNYLFMTYIVTSKPKRISVAAGVVHIISCPLVS